MITVIFTLWHWIVPAALASGDPTIYVQCGGLIGCGRTGEALTGALTTILRILVTLGASLSSVFLIYGALQMVVPYFEGSEEAGKKTIYNALKGLGITLLSGVLVEFVATSSFEGASADPIKAIMQWAITAMITIFNALFFIAIVYAGIQMVMDQGKGEGYQKGFTIIKWAVIGAIVVNLSRAILDTFINFVV